MKLRKECFGIGWESWLALLKVRNRSAKRKVKEWMRLQGFSAETEDESSALLRRPNAEFSAAMQQCHHVKQAFVVTLDSVRHGHVP